ncbi:MAG: tetratricopeptide repeat protein [Nitrospirae bacterium]|nr:tetratricopeptide repeat protein [Nitrospirota bacterium]
MRRRNIYILVILSMLLLAAEALALNIKEVLITEELKKAWVLLEMKEYRSAVDMLNGCYDNSKGQPDLLASCNFIYAKILEREQDTTAAIERYRKVYTNSTNDKVKEDALLRRSDLNLVKKFYNDAKSGYLLFIKNYPNSRQVDKAYVGLAKSLIALDKLPEAIETLDKAGSNTEALYEKANTLQRMDRVKEAKDVYATAIRQDKNYIRKNNDETLYYYGENLLSSGDVKEAKEAFSAIKEKDLQDKASLGLGLIAMKESKPDRASIYLNKIANSKDRDIRQQALINLSKLQLKSGNTEEVKKNLNTLKGSGLKEKGKEEAVSLLIDLYVKEKKFKDAASSVKTLFSKTPNSKEMLDRIEGVMTEAMKEDGNQFVDLWISYGTLLLTKSREPFILQAKDALKDSGKPYVDVLTWISKNSSDMEKHKALSELTEIYSNDGDKANAVKYLAELKNLKVPNDELIKTEAHIYFNNRDYKDALKIVMLAKKLNKDDLEIIRNSLLMVPKNEAAVLFYEKAVKDFGGVTDDYLALADAFYDLGNTENAVNYYKKALSSEPANEWAVYRLGAALSGQESEAMLKNLQGGNSPISRFSKAALKEAKINKRIAGEF